MNAMSLQAYSVWDRTTRLFHWINFLSILGLIATGLVIYNGKTLGVSGDGKILLKTLHTYFGYAFAVNLAWRILWGFIGNRYARWSRLVPGRGFLAELRTYLQGAKAGHPPSYLGHNPLGRLMVGLLFLLLAVQAATGLLLAGTDLYMPPFGNTIAAWVAASPEHAAALTPGSKEFVDPQAFAAMREFRAPFIETHELVFFAILFAITLHMAAVVLSEIREQSGLVSAMLNGKKVLSTQPVDAPREDRLE